MHLSTHVSQHHASLEHAFLAWQAAHTDAALVGILGSLSAYIVAGQRVLAPAAERLVDAAAATEHAREHARIRVLLLRLCAMKKLGSARIETAMTELQANVAALRALEERTLVPELERALPDAATASLVRGLEVEHAGSLRAFRQVVARARATEAQRVERAASAAA